jgi:hypothetical protein
MFISIDLCYTDEFGDPFDERELNKPFDEPGLNKSLNERL